ncbi:MAG: hypothetical protein IPH54_01230 [Rhodoferax sp.]|nr:hypothetical protein [Rhodoferax sp.]
MFIAVQADLMGKKCDENPKHQPGHARSVWKRFWDADKRFTAVLNKDWKFKV